MRYLVPILVLVALLAAACGSAPSSPSVAGGSDTTAAPPPSDSGTDNSTGGGGPGFTMKTQNAEKFAQCMRKHGVPNFPDPGSGGSIAIGGRGSGIDPNSPAFKSAMQACRSLLPKGHAPSAQEQAKIQAQALAFARCMRAHGVPSFPDPQFSSSGSGFRVQIGGKGSGLDPNSPAFKSAQKACASKLPGKVTGGFRAP
jgi:hypothetical protein